MAPNVSKHARLRSAQRGIAPDDLHWLIGAADLERPIGSGATLFLCSKEQRHFAPSDKLGRYGVILSDDGTVITVLPIRQSKAGRRYMRRE